ncbi:hypothetical protein [Microbacterium sp. NPDC087589]|uniref:hypothetical protein n=1 Tax=Microbacterium sp. NPDC087589 TaxID=3364191 RepID=UPI003828E8CF
MPEQNPEFADIYGVFPHVVPDAHNAPRRNVVVQPRADIVTLLGRTSNRAGFDEDTCLLSEIDDSCRLDKEGMFELRFKHSIFRAHFSNANDCEFYGALGSGEARSLQEFWDRVNGF